MFRNKFLKSKKIVSIFVSLALVFGLILGAMPDISFAEDAKTLTILHTNDIHGRFEFQDPEGREPSIGFARLKAKVDQMKGEDPNTLVLDAGDTFHGTVDINLSKGEAMVDLMNLVGYDAMVPGNHDFNFGYDRLIELKGLTDFPIIAGNIVKDEDNSTDFDPYEVFELDNGLKVGVFGLATEETKYKSHPDNTEGITFSDYMEASRDAVAELNNEGVDIVVGLAHVGIDEETNVTTEDVANEVAGIDVIIDGHSHTELPEGKMVGDTLIAQTGSHLQSMGIVELEFDGEKVSSKTASLFTVGDAVDEGLEEDKDVKKKIDDMIKENEKVKEEVIGKTEVTLVGERGYVRTGETNLGNLITDAMLFASPEADVAITNGGGIRASIEKGDITLGGAMKAFPFTNFLSTITVKGQDIMDALEHGVDSYPETAGKFPHVGGMKYKFDADKPAGSRVLEVTVDGEYLDLEKDYNIVTNDFMAIGGDGYTSFEGKPIIEEGALLSDVLVDYLKKEGTVKPKVEGRITIEENVMRLFGSDRIQTAIGVSKRAYEDGEAKTAILVGYNGQPDALTGTVLASEKDAPLLITRKNKLEDNLKEELGRLGTQEVYILGGSSVVGEEVKTQLEAMEITVERLEGETRVQTANEIAKEVFGETAPEEAFVVEYNALADALAIGPVAAEKRAPIFMTGKDKVFKDTEDIVEDYKLKDLTIVGGTSVVSEKGEKALEKLTGIDVARINGGDRIETSVSIAKEYFDNLENVVVASGYDPYVDALTAGYFASRRNAPIILSNTDEISDPAYNYVVGQNKKIFVIGGEKAISLEVLMKIKDNLKVEESKPEASIILEDIAA